MKIQYSFLLLALFFSSNNLYSQNTCDTIYESAAVNEPAEFGIPKNEIMQFINDKIIPLVEKEHNETKETISHINCVFTISEKGELIKVEFPQLKSSKGLQEKMAQEFIKLKWKPAVLNKQNVCSEFFWRINCLKWQ